MTDKNEKYLAPIREICKKIKENDSVSSYCDKLLVVATSGQFYAYYVFTFLLELLTENPNIEENKASKIFKVLKSIYDIEPDLNKRLLSCYAGFIGKSINEKSSKVLIDEAVKFTKLNAVQNVDLVKKLMEITDYMFQFDVVRKEKKYRDTLNWNIELVIRACADNTDLQVILFQAIHKTTIKYHPVENNWNISCDFLSSVVYKELKTLNNMKLHSKEAFLEYIRMIESLTCYKSQDIIMIWSKITQEFNKFLPDEENLKINSLLHKCLNAVSGSTINAKTLNEIQQFYFKDARASSKDSIQHAAIEVIVGVFVSNMEKLDLSENCFVLCCDFVIKLFNFVKYIKDDNGKSKKCCSDIKRHLIYSLVCNMLEYCRRLISSGIFTKKIEKYLLYFNDYAFVLRKELKCPSAQLKYERLFECLRVILFNLFISKTIESSSISTFSQIYTSLVNAHDLKKDEGDRTIKIVSTGSWICNIKYDKEKIENVQMCADTIIYPIIFSLIDNDTNNFESKSDNLIKMIVNLHQSVSILNYTSVVEYLKRKLENSKFDKYSITDQHLKEMAALELDALNRYESQNIEKISKLYQTFIDVIDDDLLYFARVSCSVRNEKIIKETDVKRFKDLNDLLEKYAKKEGNDNIKILVACAINNYLLYYLELESLQSNIKDTTDEIPGCLNLKNELKIVNLLDKSLEYFTDVAIHVKKNPEAIQKINSLMSLIIIMENISTQYFVRGIAYKDLETKLVLWHFVQDENKSEQLIDIAAYFLDNLKRMKGNTGQYLTISKKLKYIKIEDIIYKANGILENLLVDIEKKSEAKQVRPLNYMISLWTHYMLSGDYNNGIKMWKMYNEVKKVSNIETTVYSGTMEAKKHVSLVDIQQKCFNRNAISHLYYAIIHLQSIKTIYADYSNNFNFIYRTIIVKVINHALNRMVDLDHYTTAMLTLKAQAVKTGLFVKTLEFLSLSALRNLNMEKINDAKIDLSKMTKMLQLKDEIMVEIPIKSNQMYPVINYDNAVTSRKAIPKLSSDQSIIEIFNDSFERSSDLMEQLQSFIHENKCKCSLCQYPQLKFILFQMGCHYSRMFFLMDRYEVSANFNNYAIDPWRNSSMKILRSKDCEAFSINKADFITFSIRWLFQSADTLIRTQRYEEAEEIYTEIELLCTNNIDDFICIKQGLLARMQDLEFLQHHKDFDKNIEEKQLIYEDFLKSRPPKVSPTTSVKSKNYENKSNKASATAKKVIKKDTVPKSVTPMIYIDSDSDECKPQKKKTTTSTTDQRTKRAERLRKL